MKIGDFEVQITSPEGLPFHEICDPSTGEIYVVAEPGKQFELRYRVNHRSVSLLPYRHEFHVGAKIDGRDANSLTRLTTKKYEGKHFGFVRHGDAKGTSYDLFKFASATAGNEAGQANLSTEFQVGKVKVTVQEYQPASGLSEYVGTRDNTGSKVPSLPEGSQQSSLMHNPCRLPFFKVLNAFPFSCRQEILPGPFSDNSLCWNNARCCSQ